LWNVDTGQELLTLTQPGFKTSALLFSPAGDTLAAGALRELSTRGPVELWRAPSFAEIEAKERTGDQKQAKNLTKDAQ
jgi:hypothetical protein